MEVKLCPYCMQMTFGDFCKNCNKKVDYHGKPMQLPVGTELQGYHHYIVGAALGQGGFGVTYLALDTDTNQRMALKEFFPVHCSGRSQGVTVMAYDGQEEDFEKGKHNFLREAQTLQRLAKVESVVEVYDCFQENNTVYLAMEFVEGQSLKNYLDDHGPFEPETFFLLIKPLLEDIAKMHRQGVIHRDIAPDNIILATDGRLRLIDFGTAQEYMGGASMTVVVKKGFAPVEQYTRKGQGTATDVYALAATIYYCITGQLVPASMDRFDNDTLDWPSELGVKLPKHQEDALIRALGVQVKDRTPTVDAFLAELFPDDLKLRLKANPLPKSGPDPVLQTEPKLNPALLPKTAPKPTPAAKSSTPKKKKPIWIGAAAAVGLAVVLAVVGIVLAISGRKEIPEVRTEPETTVTEKETPEETEASRETIDETESSQETIVETEPPRETVPVRNIAYYPYAYSDDPADNSCYTAEEFAELVKYDNVREYLPLGTKIKMVPNFSEITDAYIEFELAAYRHYRLADGSDMAKTTWLAVNLLNETRWMNFNGTNHGGWAECELRNWMNETLYPSLPDYWKDLMQSVQVRSTAGESSEAIVISKDYLFLPSVGEVDSWYITDIPIKNLYQSEIDADAEESTFSCFPDIISAGKQRKGQYGYWWLRSPYPSDKSFYYIGSPDSASYVSYRQHGICPCFCI